LGFGLFEHLYARALERELVRRGHMVAREVWVDVSYKGEPLGSQRLDMIVDGKVIVENKSTMELHKAAAMQCVRGGDGAAFRARAKHQTSGLSKGQAEETNHHSRVDKSRGYT
jgi:hypothetical protein